MTDGYSSYQKLAKSHPGLVLAHCMAHCRRKYVEALPAYPQCEAALEWIKALYQIERGLPKLRGLRDQARAQALALRAQVRKERSAPLMDALHAWALEQSALRDSLLDKAISYMLNLWPGLVRFLSDPRLELGACCRKGIGLGGGEEGGGFGGGERCEGGKARPQRRPTGPLGPARRGGRGPAPGFVQLQQVMR